MVHKHQSTVRASKDESLEDLSQRAKGHGLAVEINEQKKTCTVTGPIEGVRNFVRGEEAEVEEAKPAPKPKAEKKKD